MRDGGETSTGNAFAAINGRADEEVDPIRFVASGGSHGTTIVVASRSRNASLRQWYAESSRFKNLISKTCFGDDLRVLPGSAMGLHK